LGSTIELANFLSWLSKSKPNISTSVIYASSCTVYDRSESAPFTEDTSLKATSPYGQSKLASENLLKHFAYNTKTPVICFRFFNAAGADSRGHLGEFHNPETHLIPLLLQSAKSLKKTFDIYGNNYPTKDGTCVRDFVHVSDIAQAHVCAITKYEATAAPSANRHYDQPLFNQYNLGSGNGTSVLAALRAAEQGTGHHFEVRYRENRPGDAPSAVANIGKAGEELSWHPQKSNVQQIINDALSSMSSSFE
jgi:UDP-glucose 4-epimerase